MATKRIIGCSPWHHRREVWHRYGMYSIRKQCRQSCGRKPNFDDARADLDGMG
jgi:hypothetical protein